MKKSRASRREARAAAHRRLETYGVHALSDRELLTALLGDRPPGGFDALLDMWGLHGIERCTPDELRRMAGLGPTGAAKVVAAVELGRRTLTRAPKPRVRLEEPWVFATARI